MAKVIFPNGDVLEILLDDCTMSSTMGDLTVTGTKQFRFNGEPITYEQGSVPRT